MNLSFENRVVTDPAGRNEVWIHGGPAASRLLVTGSVTGTPPLYRVKGAMHDPAAAFTGELVDELHRAGILVEPAPAAAPAPLPEPRVLLVEESPPLREIVFYTNKRSVNLFSEALGALVDSLNFERAVKEHLASIGIDSSGARLADACGLSPLNAAPAVLFTDLLLWAYPRAPRAFWDSLPEGTVDGALDIYSDHPALGHRLHAKTGSLRGVRALSGYLLSPRDGPLAFTILVNNYTCTPQQLQESLRAFLAALLQ
jgi:D-alanyl-D-alanine carboxypeptidase/D-alanyl-D-alanine-endopeptidase (penicillin-binding protein 4)